MQGGEYPDVIHLATGREAALTERHILHQCFILHVVCFIMQVF